MPPISKLLLPPKHLASFIAAAIFRDTSGSDLDDHDRFNYFPASPLVTVTYIIQGQLRLADEISDLETVRQASAMPRLSLLPPQKAPLVSWSPASITAVTLVIFPDAAQKMGFDFTSGALPNKFVRAFSTFTLDYPIDQNWALFCAMITPIWDQNRTMHWSGSDKLADWTRHIFSRVMISNDGRHFHGSSLRTIERRIKSWTGQTRQSLDFFAKMEHLHQLQSQSPDARPSILAHDAGYSDQSHMGRAVKRATGFSPAELNRRIEGEEAFWCYRLLGERF